jgi:hypothetical protein
MPPAPKHIRRWFWFSVGTMLLVVTVFALWLGWQLKLIRDRKNAAIWLSENGDGVTSRWSAIQEGFGDSCPKAEIPFWRRAGVVDTRRPIIGTIL